MALLPITFHFFNNPGLGSWLVRARLSSAFSHVGVEFADGRFFHSTFLHGNVEQCMSTLPHRAVYSTQIWVSTENYKAALEVAEDAVGKKYDYLGLLGFLLGKQIHNEDAYFCSELGRLIFEAATNIRIPLFTLVTPEQLRLIVDTYLHTRSMTVT